MIARHFGEAAVRKKLGERLRGAVILILGAGQDERGDGDRPKLLLGRVDEAAQQRQQRL
jgi:hypothetical protein